MAFQWTILVGRTGISVAEGDPRRLDLDGDAHAAAAQAVRAACDAAGAAAYVSDGDARVDLEDIGGEPDVALGALARLLAATGRVEVVLDDD